MFNYMQLMQKLHSRLAVNDPRPDRTNTGTASIFDHTLEYSLNEYFPLLPFRKVPWEGVVIELLWFLRGETNIAFLERHGCKWWSDQCSTDGDVGPMYGAQWRGYMGQDGIQRPDQFATLIKGLISDPYGRRHVVDSWEASAIPENNCNYDENVRAGKMAIAPCHPLYQCHVEDINGVKNVNLKFYMRSSDTFLGLPANIASYSLLLEIIGALTGYRANRVIWNGGDVHLYANHDKACSTLIEQWRNRLGEKGGVRYGSLDLASERACPTYILSPKFLELVNVETLDFSNEELVPLLINGLRDYNPAPAISARMAR